MGVIVTYLLIPDLTGLDLREGDKRWLAILAGEHDAYHGDAVRRMLGGGLARGARRCIAPCPPAACAAPPAC